MVKFNISHFLFRLIAISVFLSLASLITLFTLPQSTYAAGCGGVSSDPPWGTWTESSNVNAISFGGFVPGEQWKLFHKEDGFLAIGEYIDGTQTVQPDRKVTFNPTSAESTTHLTKSGGHTLSIRDLIGSEFCSVHYNISSAETLICDITVTAATSLAPGDSVPGGGNFRYVDPAGKPIRNYEEGLQVDVWLTDRAGTERASIVTTVNASGNYSTSGIIIPSITTGEEGEWRIRAGPHRLFGKTEFCATAVFVSLVPGSPIPTTPPGGGAGGNPCGVTCETALGDIPVEAQKFATTILRIGIGLAGGIALIIMVIGSIRVLTSSGDQQKLAGGRDMIVGALAGLLFLIFSVLILRFIGFSIIGFR
ncbi:hypothetical protein HYU92_01570 [Candidatus Curtissbacteria bacterium]|nr:hypothetical protein [Candidatus Curtissbacteria bacterium]